MEWVKKYVIEKFLAGWLKKELDKIPGDGLKTILSLIFVVATASKIYFPEFAQYFDLALSILASVGISDQLALQLSISGLGISLMHKVLKKLSDLVNKTKNGLPLAKE